MFRMLFMLAGMALGALMVGAIIFTVSYQLTRLNILDTVKAALDQAATSMTKKALAVGFEGMIREKKDNVVKLDLLIAESERLEVTINASGVGSDIYDGMKLESAV